MDWQDIVTRDVEAARGRAPEAVRSLLVDLASASAAQATFSPEVASLVHEFMTLGNVTYQTWVGVRTGLVDARALDWQGSPMGEPILIRPGYQATISPGVQPAPPVEVPSLQPPPVGAHMVRGTVGSLGAMEGSIYGTVAAEVAGFINPGILTSYHGQIKIRMGSTTGSSTTIWSIPYP